MFRPSLVDDRLKCRWFCSPFKGVDQDEGVSLVSPASRIFIRACEIAGIENDEVECKCLASHDRSRGFKPARRTGCFRIADIGGDTSNPIIARAAARFFRTCRFITLGEKSVIDRNRIVVGIEGDVTILGNVWMLGIEQCKEEVVVVSTNERRVFF